MSASPTPALYRHPRPHAELWRRYRHYGAQRDFRKSVLASIAFFLGSVVVSFFAIQYATESASSPVTDIVLSNIPPVDVDGFFAFGTLLLIIYTLLLLAAHPKRIPFVLNALGLFYVIRSIFTSLTHIGPFPTSLVAQDWGTLAQHFLFSSDLFFSAHTGVAFLLALIFWRERGVRTAFLAWSIFMATIVLLGHYHYSIDVASAFFITYTIFHIAEWLFPKDRAVLLADEMSEMKGV